MITHIVCVCLVVSCLQFEDVPYCPVLHGVRGVQKSGVETLQGQFAYTLTKYICLSDSTYNLITPLLLEVQDAPLLQISCNDHAKCAEVVQTSATLEAFRDDLSKLDTKVLLLPLPEPHASGSNPSCTCVLCYLIGLRPRHPKPYHYQICVLLFLEIGASLRCWRMNCVQKATLFKSSV